LLHSEKEKNKREVRFVDILAVLADGRGRLEHEGALSVIFIQFSFCPETHTWRQATQLVGDKDRGCEIVYVRKKIFCTGPTRAAKAEQKSLVPERQAQRTNPSRTPFTFTL
jgi:hypothetical protein